MFTITILPHRLSPTGKSNSNDSSDCPTPPNWVERSVAPYGTLKIIVTLLFKDLFILSTSLVKIYSA